MKVLIACEESQTSCIAFRHYGHEAYSCDLLPPSGGHPEWHIQDDALKVLYSSSWDLVIAHPPCTFLSKAGAHLLYPGGVLNEERYLMGLAARDFFYKFYDYPGRICIENPVPLAIYGLPDPSQIIQPFMFGHDCSKKTYLWLKDLPILMATDIVVPTYSFTFKHSTGKARSKSFPGISLAMASQWGYTNSLEK